MTQWGTGTTNTRITMPIAFKDIHYFAISACLPGNVTNYWATSTYIETVNTFFMNCSVSNTICWFAIHF